MGAELIIELAIKNVMVRLPSDVKSQDVLLKSWGPCSSTWSPGSWCLTGLHRVGAVPVYQTPIGRFAIPITISFGVVPERIQGNNARRPWIVVGGVARSPVFLNGVSGVGGTLEKFGGVGLTSADAPSFG